MSVAALSIKPLRGASLRDAVFRRDGGVCALCGTDTELSRLAVEAMRAAARGDKQYAIAFHHWQRTNKLPRDGKWWHADHVRPVVAGEEIAGADGSDDAAQTHLHGLRHRRPVPSCQPREPGQSGEGEEEAGSGGHRSPVFRVVSAMRRRVQASQVVKSGVPFRRWSSQVSPFDG